ncbi:fumarylacetoacetate hydrolase [Halobacteriales archaeon QS_3_64_16]|nr:MAG: fumarylacetoacetate hydrolase [Halobacteriales archaeon QS_3_64_16]
MSQPSTHEWTDRYLARTATGEALLGDDRGFVPLAAADPALETVGEALRVAPEGLPDPRAASASPVGADGLSFGTPFDPGRLLGIGLNYADHAADLDETSPTEPATFLKPRTSLTGPSGPIRLPPTEITDRVTAEAELAIVIGRTCRDVPVEEVGKIVAGYLPVIDLTAEDVLQRNPRFLTRAKGFDTFLVVGPQVAVLDAGAETDGDTDAADDTELSDDFAGLADLSVRTIVDGEVVAENTVSNMHASPTELVSFCSRSATLRPGDVISTGTPGAGVIEPGDTVGAEVDRVGTVSAPVVRDSGDKME